MKKIRPLCFLQLLMLNMIESVSFLFDHKHRVCQLYHKFQEQILVKLPNLIFFRLTESFQQTKKCKKWCSYSNYRVPFGLLYLKKYLLIQDINIGETKYSRTCQNQKRTFFVHPLGLEVWFFLLVSYLLNICPDLSSVN